MSEHVLSNDAKLSVLLVASFVLVSGASNFYQDFDITWGEDHVKILDNGELTTLSLDSSSGSGFRSKDEYLFGEFGMDMKLAPGDSAGTVTTFYLTSIGEAHDEIDFEFLGNLSGDPYVLHTNVFTQGMGGREQQFYLWFDPTADFHTYSILWNPLNIIFSVDGTPMRVFKNCHATKFGLPPFPTDQPMRARASLWDGESWATRGGLVKTNWADAPFTAQYRNYSARACTCGAWMSRELDAAGEARLAAARADYMIYDYCGDALRFPAGPPPECSLNSPSSSSSSYQEDK